MKRESIKKAKVVSLTFSNTYQNPANATVYYYLMVLDDLTTGSIGTTTENDPRFQPGREIFYRIDPAKPNKIIYEKAPEDKKATSRKPTNDQPAYSKPNYAKTQTDFLGQAWAYAKDLVIAGKKLEDVTEMTKIANAIYDEIGKNLSKDKSS